MAALLRTDLDEFGREFGEDFLEQLTYPGIFRGAPRSVAPVLVEVDGNRTLVIGDADSQAARVLPESVSIIRYGRYFTWDVVAVEAEVGFADAVRGAANGQPIVCDGGVPQARYEALASTGPISMFGDRAAPVVSLYHKPIAEIEAQWRLTREADCAMLADYLKAFPHSAHLIEALYARNEGFAPLERLCRGNGLDALLVTSSYEIEVLTGLPEGVAKAHGIIALYRTGADDIVVCARKPIDRADFVVAGGAAPLSGVLLGIGAVGAQKSDMSASLWRTLGEAGVQLADGDLVLRRWQDCRAGDDFGYFVFAANAVIEGMAAAHAFFKRMSSSPLTERDLVAAYYDGVRRFAWRLGFEGRISNYFQIVHSGTRTLLPATAADYPVSREDSTIALDMGLVVRDSAGCARAVSDIARTFCATSELAEIYKALRAVLVDDLIPRIRPGLTGEQIHAIGLDCLRPLEGRLRAAALLPLDKRIDDYRRDCGHAIQRQTISSVYFVPGNRQVIDEGMLGCVEYVWPIGDVLIAVEEGYVVTREGTFPFTREVPA